MEKILVLILLMVLLMGGFSIESSETVLKRTAESTNISSETVQNLDKPWFQKTQVYDMVALPPSDVEKYHITVNGLWNGFMQEEEMEPSKVEFYVDDLLKATDVEIPYIWAWDEIAFGDHEIKIIAYDHNGNQCK